MISLFKTAVRSVLVVGVLAGLAAGGTLLLAGPDSAKALFQEFREDVQDTIDAHVDDPTAMRQELIELEKEYPERIGQVRGDLAELREQIAQLEREQEISDKVVSLADADLAELRPLLAQAQEFRAQQGQTQPVSIHFGDATYDYDRALARRDQIVRTRRMYQSRSSDAAHDLTYLRQQAQRLEDLAVQLETERAEFQSQIQGLTRQVDAIARNDRLIELLGERNKTIEECSRFETVSLDQVTARLSEIRSRQEAELQVLADQQHTADYEEKAREELERGQRADRAYQAATGGRTALTQNLAPQVFGD